MKNFFKNIASILRERIQNKNDGNFSINKNQQIKRFFKKFRINNNFLLFNFDYNF